jgi:3-oxoacyl-[acyl-carrier protein] reductase
VTGAANGLGLATAELLLDRGATVALVDLDRERVEREAARLAAAGAPAHGFAADLTDLEQAGEMVDAVIDRYGRIDILVNLAGIYPAFPTFAETTPEFWRRVIAGSVDTTFCCCKAVLPHMTEAGYGRIVNTSSGVVLTGWAGNAAYTTGKAGIIGFTRVLAREVGPSGITANVIMPGMIATEHALQSMDEVATQAIIAQQSVPRLGEPIDIAHAVAFLVSDDASFITGQTLNVGGGINYV